MFFPQLASTVAHSKIPARHGARLSGEVRPKLAEAPRCTVLIWIRWLNCVSGHESQWKWPWWCACICHFFFIYLYIYTYCMSYDALTWRYFGLMKSLICQAAQSFLHLLAVAADGAAVAVVWCVVVSEMDLGGEDFINCKLCCKLWHSETTNCH